MQAYHYKTIWKDMATSYYKIYNKIYKKLQIFYIDE